jgi:hypothetical protein
MRCAKCGYFSFDYLSECKKCRTNLADVRVRLGFSGATPAIPSMLGSLFRDYGPAANQVSELVAIATSDPLDFAEKLDSAPRPVELESQTVASPLVFANAEEAEEDFSLLDLSDEELDLLIDEKAFATGDIGPAIQTRTDTDDVDFTLPECLSSSDPAPEAFKIEPAEVKMSPVPPSGDLELIFDSNDYLPQFRDEPAAAAPTITLNQELSLDLPELDRVPGVAASEFEAFQQPGGPQNCKSEDDFVIELSEDDLDSLLVELSHPPKGEVGAESKG